MRLGFPESKLLFFLRKRRLARWARWISVAKGRFVWVAHETIKHDSTGQEAVLDQLIRKTIFTRCDSLVVLEESTLPEVVKQFGPVMVPVYWSPIGDLAEFHGPRVDQLAARLSLGLPQEIPIIVLLGTARNSRNPDEIAEAAKTVDAHFVFVGAGYESLDSQVSNRNITVLGFLSKEDVATIMSATDWVINHAQHYLNSGAIRISVSYGKPVIAYPFGAALDCARGCLVSLGEDKPLASVLRDLPRRDSKKYAEMVAFAELSNDKRTWKASVDGLVSAILGLENRTLGTG